MTKSDGGVRRPSVLHRHGGRRGKQAVQPLTQETALPLPDGSSARNQDIHESPGALLPIMAGAHMGDADKRTKQVRGVQIFSQIAVLFCAFYQFIDRSLDQAYYHSNPLM